MALKSCENIEKYIGYQHFTKTTEANFGLEANIL